MNTSTISNDTLNLTSALELIQKLQAENNQLQKFKSQTFAFVDELIERKDCDGLDYVNPEILQLDLEAIEFKIKNPPEPCVVEDSDDSDSDDEDSDDDDDDEFVEVNPDDYVNHYEINKKFKGANLAFKSSPAKMKLVKKNWIIYDKILDLQKYLKKYLINYELIHQEIHSLREIVFTVNRVDTEMTASLKTLQEQQKTLQQQYKTLLYWRDEYALEEYQTYGESAWLQKIYGIPVVEDINSWSGHDEMVSNVKKYYHNCRDAKLKELSTHKIED